MVRTGHVHGAPGAEPLERDSISRSTGTISVSENTSCRRLRGNTLLTTSACARMHSHSCVARSRRAGAQSLRAPNSMCQLKQAAGHNGGQLQAHLCARVYVQSLQRKWLDYRTRCCTLPWRAHRGAESAADRGGGNHRNSSPGVQMGAEQVRNIRQMSQRVRQPQGKSWMQCAWACGTRGV